MKLRRLLPHEGPASARLIHAALDTWYRRNLNSDKFGNSWEPFQVIPDTYQALDPGCCVVAEDTPGTLLGLAFYHPRPTHVGVGIVAIHPSATRRGYARALMEEIIRLADGLPLRLVSSAMNLDSFSLYTKLGFVPHETYQDLTLQVPAEGLPGHFPGIRPATPADVPALAALEYRLSGLRREKDLHFFLQDPSSPWRVTVLENASGEMLGYLAAHTHPASPMLGPGIAVDQSTAATLIHASLHHHFKGLIPLFLVPLSCHALVRQAYEWGARNVEIHLASTHGPMLTPTGIILPTFLPESG